MKSSSSDEEDCLQIWSVIINWLIDLLLLCFPFLQRYVFVLLRTNILFRRHVPLPVVNRIFTGSENTGLPANSSVPFFFFFFVIKPRARHKGGKQTTTMFRNQYDNDITTWSPQGRLYQIEYAMEAVKQGSACVGLKSKTHAVICTLKRSSSELASHQQKIFNIDEHIGIAIAGLTSDARVLSAFMRTECMNHKFVYGTPMQVGRLVLRVADSILSLFHVFFVLCCMWVAPYILLRITEKYSALWQPPLRGWIVGHWL